MSYEDDLSPSEFTSSEDLSLSILNQRDINDI